jgi:hypothetical protein
MRLRLYVAGGAPNSVLATANLAAICKAHLRYIFKLEIIDVLKFPLRALPTASGDAAPVSRRRPAARIVGNLGDTTSVLHARA